MIRIAKESLAPVHFESLRQKHRTDSGGLVPEIVFCPEANGREAIALVKVVQKTNEGGIPFEFKLRDEDFGKFRASWADHEGKPHCY